MASENTTTSGHRSSGPNTVFMPGDERVVARRVEAASPAAMVWGNQPVVGLSDAVIMMVDDEPLAIEMTEAFLESAGYLKFVWTTRPEEAVELMRSKRPRLLLLDLTMPKLNGMQILDIMRKDTDLCHVPVIVLTSTLDPEVKLQALSLGAMDFLSKPVDPSELALRIRNTLAATVYRDYLAQHDALTGLPNKLRYQEAVAAALARSGPDAKGALIHIGVDQLRSVNDAMGRAAGDQLLQRIAKRLSHCVEAESAAADGSADDLPMLYRFDGDEFAVLLPRLEDIETAAAFISRLLDAASTSFNRDRAQEIFVTSSIGVAVFPDDGGELDRLLTNAGLAMRHAKRSGRQTYAFFSADLNRRAVRTLSRGADLRMALTRGQVELLYQPRVDTGGRTLTGAQAIASWRHPSGEVFEGEALLDMAATSEMSMALVEWMLQQLRDQTRIWRELGTNLPRVGITIDLDQLTLDQVCDILRVGIRGGLQPTCLSVEFRGGAGLGLTQAVAEALAGMKKTGVHFVLDGFGGPRSSLLQLRWPLIEKVKIHPLFFQPGSPGRNGSPLVIALVAIARQMGLSTVASGIDQQRQVKLVEAQHCDEYQGALVGPPATAVAFAERWLAA